MNASSLAHRAYAPNIPSVRTLRGTEYEVIAQATRRLKDTAENAKANFSAFAAALHENRSLWNVLAIDVADPANALPAPLRAQIFYLAEFTNHHTRKVFSNDASVAALIDINTAILRGLKQSGDPT